jgi:hypothetical protein
MGAHAQRPLHGLVSPSVMEWRGSEKKPKRPRSPRQALLFSHRSMRQSHRSLVTVFDPSGPSLRTVFESQPPRPVVSTSRLSTRSRLSTPTPGTGGGTVIAGRSSMTLLSCAPAGNDAAATSTPNINDLIIWFLPLATLTNAETGRDVPLPMTPQRGNGHLLARAIGSATKVRWWAPREIGGEAAPKRRFRGA